MTTKAIIFDIDGTLSPEISWLALTRDLGASVDEHLRIYADLKQGKIDYTESKRQLIDLWRATGNANKPFFQKLFENWPLDPFAKQIVQQAQTKHKVCLITGSMNLYAQIVANKLGVKDWYANTTLHWDENDELDDMDYELKQAEKKLEQFQQFCQAQNIQPEECIVVGDGENDIELFKLSGKGVLITTPETGGEHKKQAWKIANNLGELKQILEER
jgi:phosphoserine phosphatase